MTSDAPGRSWDYVTWKMPEYGSPNRHMTARPNQLAAGGLTSSRFQVEPVVQAGGHVAFRMPAPDAKSVQLLIKGAGILRYKPNIKWKKDRGKEPKRPKADYPWFWNWDETTEDFMGTGTEPDGSRWNGCHYTNRARQAARNVAKGAKHG